MQQMFEMGLNFDHVIVPSGSAGTHAGMIAGFYGNNMDIPMSGIDVSRPGDVQQGIVHKLAQETLDYIGAGVQLPMEKVVCYGDYYQPRATSSSIITRKPSITLPVPTWECSPRWASGMSSSTTT